MPVIWFLRLDKTRVAYSSWDVLGLGKTGLVLKHGEHALKIARVEDTADYCEAEQDRYEVLNEMNVDSLSNEIEIYKRLGSHPGLLQIYRLTDESIEMAVASRGTLERYFRTQEEPPDVLKAGWIESVVSTISYVHTCLVTVDDIALRNFMIDDQSAIKLIDFGLSTLRPPPCSAIESIAVHSDIFQTGFIVYSIATWSNYEYDDYMDGKARSTSTHGSTSLDDSPKREFKWPSLESLPSLEGCPWGDVIRKCWTGGYNTMEELCKDVQRAHDSG